jgi:hypothetical protein
MKFEQIKVEFEKYESIDIIALSNDDVTDASLKNIDAATLTKIDPYANDKF